MRYLDHDFPHTKMYDSDLRELIHMYEELKSNYSKLVDGYEELHNMFNTLEDDFAALALYVNSEVTELKEEVDERISELLISVSERITRMIIEVNEMLARQREYVDSELLVLEAKFNLELTRLQQEIDELVFELPDVYNQTRGIRTELITYVDDIYNLTRDFAFKVENFDISAVTCEELDNMDKTAIEWDIDGRLYIDPPGMCLNPISGEREPVCAILQALAQEIHNITMLTATEYDALQLTAGEYDNKQITAYDYDYYGKSLLYGFA